eukprot:gene10248-2667_t
MSSEKQQLINETDSIIIPVANIYEDTDSLKGDFDEDGTPIGKGNYFQAFFNVLNTTIGAGLLSLPFAFRAGLILGPLLLIFVCFLACFNYTAMIYLSEKTKKFSFKEIAVVVFNKHVGNVFEGTNLLFNVGGIVGYTVVIGQLGYPVFIQVCKAIGVKLIPIEIFLLLIQIMIIFPLCCLRHISFLSYTSVFSICSALYAILAVVIKCIMAISNGEIDWSKVMFFETNFIKIFFAIPILFFAYGAIVTMLPSYKDLKNRNPYKMTVLVVIQIFFAAFLYFSMGSAGYILFTDATEDNILKNFTDSGDLMMTIAKLAIVLVIILSFPMIHFCCRDSIEDIFFNGWEFSWTRWILEAALLCSVSYGLAVFIPNITVVFGLTGATTGSLVVFIYPGVLLAKHHPKIIWKIAGICSAILCTILGIICTTAIVLDTFNIVDPK